MYTYTGLWEDQNIVSISVALAKTPMMLKAPKLFPGEAFHSNFKRIKRIRDVTSSTKNTHIVSKLVSLLKYKKRSLSTKPVLDCNVRRVCLYHDDEHN